MRKLSIEYKKRVFTFGIPAVRCCPSALHCRKSCYAQQGCYVFRTSRLFRNKAYLNTQKGSFVVDMIKDITAKRADIIRIHDTGDFYNKAYLQKWLDIIKACPAVIFYTYTKEIGLFKEMKEALPNNLHVIFSTGGKNDELIDFNNDCHCVIFRTKRLLNKANYKDISDSDFVWNMKSKRLGLVYHGTRSWYNTDFMKVPRYKALKKEVCYAKQRSA